MKDWDLLSDSFLKFFSLGFLFALGILWACLSVFRTDTVVVKLHLEEPLHQFCVNVDSITGWHEFEFPEAYGHITYMGGAWSIDSDVLFPVGAEGYEELWESGLDLPVNRYTDHAPSGALLIEDQEIGLRWFRRPRCLSRPHHRIRLRINELNKDLFDNHGMLTVCFGKNSAKHR